MTQEPQKTPLPPPSKSNYVAPYQKAAIAPYPQKSPLSTSQETAAKSNAAPTNAKIPQVSPTHTTPTNIAPLNTATREVEKSSPLPHAQDPKNELPQFNALKGKYTIVERLGSGGQGEVYLAKSLADNSNVAVKVLHIHSVSNWKQYELFEREANVLKDLNIDGVAHFYEAIQDLDSEDPVSIIVQEYINGYSLEHYIKASRRFTLQEIADIILQLLSTLEKLHYRQNPIIHRDIKPSNILLVDNLGKLKVWLIDFGAVANPQVKDGGSTVAGTYGYMPPEQLMGHPVPQSDIYAVAVVALYLLSGRPPETIEAHAFRLIIDPILQHLPYAITVLLRRMLEPNVKDRISDIQTLISAFQAIKSNDFTKLSAIVGVSKNSNAVDGQKLYSYRQSGCIDKWTELSDAVPRHIPKRDIDRIYESLKNVHPNINDALRGFGHFSGKAHPHYQLFLPLHIKPYSTLQIETALQTITSSRPIQVTLRRKNVKRSKIIISAFGILCLVLTALSIALLIPKTLPVLHSIRDALVSSMNSAFFYAFAALTTLLFVALLILSILIYRKLLGTTQDYLKDNMTKVNPLLLYGRKTIATISELKFISPGKANQKCQPLWKISYDFNPVDDESPDDLRRSFYTRLPVDDLAIGDPLPCLYIIVRNDDSSESVFSTPWPLLEQDDIYLVDDVAALLSRDTPIREDQIKKAL